MASPIISIILPVFNGEKLLPRAIDSCLKQTFHDFELIVVDDCSTDRSLEIAKEFALKDSRVVVISNSVNKKLPASLNVGFESAKGEFLTWTSDDNFYCPNALANMHEAMLKTKADMVYADYEVVNPEGVVIERKNLKGVQHLFTYNQVGACFLYKRAVYDRLGGYRTDLFCAEDYEYWLRIWVAGYRIYHIPESLYFYADNPCSLTATKRSVVLEKTILLKMEYVDKVPVSVKTKIKALFRLYRKKPSCELRLKMIELSFWYAWYLVIRYKMTGK